MQCLFTGLIIATPTGSTAYSAATGASMVHPNVPAILISPICPHSLSFRPIVVPAGVEIKVRMLLFVLPMSLSFLNGFNTFSLHFYVLFP